MRPDISFATHQCARFAAAPKKSHSHAVCWLGRYLLHTKKKGIRFRADITCGLEVFVDTLFAGNWDKKDTQTGDHDTARSRHGYIILYYGCPLIWKSQLQTEIALSSTESKYTGLSYALCEDIPLDSPTVILEYFALDHSFCWKWCPRTKHLNCRLHHFWSYVPHRISIQHIPTDKQPADILTKAMDQSTLHQH